MEKVPKFYETWHLGDTKKLSNELVESVRTGEKTATSALVWELEANGEKLPSVKDIVVVTNWKGDPSCIIEITETEVRPFGEIDERFAFDYGEGDRTLKWWSKAMWDYYSEVCRKVGLEPSANMPISCQRFRLLHKQEKRGNASSNYEAVPS